MLVTGKKVLSAMTSAELVAQKLAAKFLEDGNYTSAASMSGTAASLISAARGLDIGPLFRQPGFAGLAVQAVGYEEGATSPRVHIYVAKGSRRAIEALPTADGEVAIEVNRIGKLMIQPGQAIQATRRGNMFLRGTRVACGSSCAPSGESYGGTYGAIVRKQTGKELYILSNNHVLAACNHTPVGMPILAPSGVDASPDRQAPREIARHAEICELRSGEPTLVNPCQEDVAIARVPEPKAVSSWQGDDENGYDTPDAIVPPRAGLEVKKFGRTTGLTTGKVETRINTLTPIPYKSKFFTACVWFQNVWTVIGEGGTEFALPGDSGSLVVTQDGRHAVGLVFAGLQNDYALFIPMDRIAACLGGLRLVSKHGVRP
jgi:hypothetical protein